MECHLGNLELVSGSLISGSKAAFHTKSAIYENIVAVNLQIVLDTTVVYNCKSLASQVIRMTSVSLELRVCRRHHETHQ